MQLSQKNLAKVRSEPISNKETNELLTAWPTFLEYKLLYGRNCLGWCGTDSCDGRFTMVSTWLVLMAWSMFAQECLQSLSQRNSVSACQVYRNCYSEIANEIPMKVIRHNIDQSVRFFNWHYHFVKQVMDTRMGCLISASLWPDICLIWCWSGVGP